MVEKVKLTFLPQHSASTSNNDRYHQDDSCEEIEWGSEELWGERIQPHPQSPNNQRPVRILAIDGGGLRGCLTVQVLKQLLGEHKIGELFDLVVGTSTGGLLAAGLSCGTPIDKCDSIYDRVAHEVFTDPFEKYFNSWIWAKLENFVMWLTTLLHFGSEPERFSSDKLADIIKELLEFPLQKMGSALPLEEVTPKCALVTTRTDLSTAQPYVLRTYDLDGSQDGVHAITFALNKPLPGTSHCPWWKACRATSAAPLYFDAMTVDVPDEDRTLTLRDGGVVANDPAIVGVLEAQHLFPGAPAFVVSLGTGAVAATAEELPSSAAKLMMGVVGDQYSAREALNRMVVRNVLDEGSNYFRFNTALEHSEMSAAEYMDGWRLKGEQLAIKNEKVLTSIQEQLLAWGSQDFTLSTKTTPAFSLPLDVLNHQVLHKPAMNMTANVLDQLEFSSNIQTLAI